MSSRGEQRGLCRITISKTIHDLLGSMRVLISMRPPTLVWATSSTNKSRDAIPEIRCTVWHPCRPGSAVVASESLLNSSDPIGPALRGSEVERITVHGELAKDARCSATQSYLIALMYDRGWATDDESGTRERPEVELGSWGVRVRSGTKTRTQTFGSGSQTILEPRPTCS